MLVHGKRVVANACDRAGSNRNGHNTLAVIRLFIPIQ